MEVAGGGVGRSDSRGVSADHAGGVPASPVDRFPAPGFRSARRRISVASIAHRRRLRRLHGRRPDGEQTKALLSARGTYGIYLCCTLRGTGLFWGVYGFGACYNGGLVQMEF